MLWSLTINPRQCADFAERISGLKGKKLMNFIQFNGHEKLARIRHVRKFSKTFYLQYFFSIASALGCLSSSAFCQSAHASCGLLTC